MSNRTREKREDSLKSIYSKNFEIEVSPFTVSILFVSIVNSGSILKTSLIQYKNEP